MLRTNGIRFLHSVDLMTRMPSIPGWHFQWLISVGCLPPPHSPD